MSRSVNEDLMRITQVCDYLVSIGGKTKDEKLMNVALNDDPGGYWWPPTCSNWLLLLVFSTTRSSVLVCIVGSTLLGLAEALHIFKVDTCGLPPNPTGLFCMFSCQLIQVDIGGHPPFPNGSKRLSGNFGNLLFLAGFNFRGRS